MNLKETITKYIKKTSFLFSISSLFLSVSTTVSSLITIGLLLPHEIGLWNSFIIIQPYIFILQLGVFNGLNREIPYQMGLGNYDKANQLASTALWICKCLSIITAILLTILFIVIYFYKNYPIENLICVLAVGILSINQFYDNYLTVTFRSNQSFRKLAQINFINSIILLISILLVYQYGFYGFIIRAIITLLIQTSLTHIYRPMKIKAKFDFALAKELMKVGFPIFILGYLQGITNTFSRLILMSIATITTVGLFAPALAIINLSKLIPGILSQYLYPKMTYNWGLNHDKNELWKWSRNAIIFTFLISIPIIIIGWLLIPIIVENYYPNYTKSILAAKISLLSISLSGIYIGLNSLNTIKAFKAVTTITILKLITFLSFQYLGGKLLIPLEGVAIGYFTADLIVSLLSAYIIYYNLKRK